MSIRDRQIAEATTAFMERELRAGRYPQASRILELLDDYFKDIPAGRPRYQFVPAIENEVSDPVAYNQMMNDIYNDLSIAFREINGITDSLLLTSDVYETEKRQLQMMVKDIETRTDSLVELLNNTSRKTVLYDSFNTFEWIDYKGDDERAIPPTDLWVDLRYGQLALETANARKVRYVIANAKTSVSYVDKIDPKTRAILPRPTMQEILPIANALKDTVNEAWQYVLTHTKNETMSIVLNIDLLKVLDANVVSVELNTVNDTNVTLLVSTDGKTYREHKSYVKNTTVEFNVTETFRYMRFTFTKNYADYALAGGKYEYDFGVSNIAVKREYYLPKGTMVSKPRIIDGTAEKITLSADHRLLTGTNINYYIGLDNAEGYVDWQEIKSGGSIVLNPPLEYQETFDGSTYQYGSVVAEEFGQKYYKLGDLMYAPVPGKTEIYMGENMWRVDTRMGTVPEGYTIGLRDWLYLQGTTPKLLDIASTADLTPFPLTPNSFQKFSTNFYCPKATTVINSMFQIDANQFQVYVNGAFLKPIITMTEGKETYKYNYSFRAGWNKIEILTYTTQVGSIKPNLILRPISTMVYAIKDPIYETTTYDLMNNVTNQDILHYSIEDRTIMVNYDPKVLDAESKGVRYVISYRMMPEASDMKLNVRLMAILTRASNNDRATPILKGYKLIIE